MAYCLLLIASLRLSADGDSRSAESSVFFQCLWFLFLIARFARESHWFYPSGAQAALPLRSMQEDDEVSFSHVARKKDSVKQSPFNLR